MSCVFEVSMIRVTWYSLCFFIFRGQRKQGWELNICFVYLRSLWKGWPEGPTKTRRETQYMICVFGVSEKGDLVLLVYLIFRGQRKQGGELDVCFAYLSLWRKVDLVLLVYLRCQWWGGGGGGEEEGHSGPWPSFRWSCPCWELWSQIIEKEELQK